MPLLNVVGSPIHVVYLIIARCLHFFLIRAHLAFTPLIYSIYIRICLGGEDDKCEDSVTVRLLCPPFLSAQG